MWGGGGPDERLQQFGEGFGALGFAVSVSFSRDVRLIRKVKVLFLRGHVLLIQEMIEYQGAATVFGFLCSHIFNSLLPGSRAPQYCGYEIPGLYATFIGLHGLQVWLEAVLPYSGCRFCALGSGHGCDCGCSGCYGVGFCCCGCCSHRYCGCRSLLLPLPLLWWSSRWSLRRRPHTDLATLACIPHPQPVEVRIPKAHALNAKPHSLNYSPVL